MGALTNLGGRWPWPAAIGITSLGAGGVLGWKLLEHIGLALLALLMVSLLIALASAAALDAHGEATARAVTAGERLILRYTLRNRSLWMLPWIMLEPQGLAALPVQGQLIGVGPRGRRELAISLPCPRRGRWPAGGWVARVGDPFGFFERVRRGHGRDTVVVYPRPLPLPGLLLPRPLGRAASRRGPASPVPAATVREVRPYQPGDLPSRIHWLSTARLDALMVKELEGEPAAHAWLVLDLDATVQYGEEDTGSVEAILGAAHLVARRLLQQQVATGLLLIGPATVVYPDQRRGQAERLLGALAVATAAPADMARDLALLRGPGRYPLDARRGMLIVVTPWADRRWTTSLPALAHAGYAILCILLDLAGAGRETSCAAQAAVLHTGGVQVYRHTCSVG